MKTEKKKSFDRKNIRNKETQAMRKDRCGGEKEIFFEYCAEPGCNICMAGSFNNWQPQELKDNGHVGKYTAIVTLPAGRHEYKFVVNGVWLHDANNPHTAGNSYGSLNSVIEV